MPFVQRAYVAALLVGSLLPTIGSFVVPKRLSLLGDKSAHIAFGATAFASLIGIAFTDVLAVPVTALATVLMLLNPYGNCVEHREKPNGKGCEVLQEKARKGRAKIGRLDPLPSGYGGKILIAKTGQADSQAMQKI